MGSANAFRCKSPPHGAAVKECGGHLAPNDGEGFLQVGDAAVLVARVQVGTGVDFHHVDLAGERERVDDGPATAVVTHQPV